MTKHQKHLISPSNLDAFEEAVKRSPVTDSSAHCIALKADPALFCSEKPSDIRLAKQVCVACPFRQQCFEFGIYETTGGTWGGVSEADLERLRNKYGIQDRDSRRQALWLNSLLISDKSAKEVAALAGTTERTIQRWRKQLNGVCEINRACS